jgi:hypothetical protein
VEIFLMRLVFLSKMICILACVLAFSLSTSSLFLSQSTELSDGLTSDEKESLQKMKDAEEQLKRYLDIANDRLKNLLAASNKGDHESADRAVTGYRTAVTGAEDTLARIQASGKNVRKQLANLFKAIKKYNFTLLQALDKAPEHARTHIQAAYEESSRVQDGLSIQMEKIEKTEKR